MTAARDDVNDAEELNEDRGSVLQWAGRSRARVAIPKPRVLEPVAEHSDPTDEDPGNLVVEGDNRQAMVSLMSQFGGKVDVVLIDPPYNTGKGDFRYDDARFDDPNADSRRGDFVSAEDGGRHTKWLNQMAPTLRILRDFLTPSGVIFIHINDIELPRLLLLMEEIFGERNRLGTIVWRGATDNNPGRIVVEHEYVVVWARDVGSVPPVWVSQEAEIRDAVWEIAREVVAGEPDLAKASLVLRRRLVKEGRFGNYARYFRLDRRWDEFGPYAAIRNTDNPGRPGYFQDIVHPVTGKVVKKPATGYRFNDETLQWLLDNDRVIYGKDETKLIEIKRYLSEIQFPLRSVVNLDSRAAANELAALFGREDIPFKNAKPSELEAMFLSYVARRDAIVLDAFAGSGTTGHAVMKLNKRDGGTRRFILIEEGADGDAYAATLTAERLRRARVQEGLPGGFTFQKVGGQINTEEFAKLHRKQLVATILQTDTSGRGGGIRPIKGGDLVIGRNARNEAICVYYDPNTHASVTSAILRRMYEEADRLGLARPLRVYGSSCDIFGSDSFTFFRLPDEVLNNLWVAIGAGS